MHTANKCGLQNVHVAVIGRYLSLSARAHLSASDNVGSTFFSYPMGARRLKSQGIYMQFYTVITRTRQEKERVWGGGEGNIIRPAPRVVYSTESAER